MPRTRATQQCAAILAELSHGPRTSTQLRRSCHALALTTRIHELRAQGYLITTQLVPVGRSRAERVTIALYTLLRKRPAARKRA